jgi:hypothetical protein
MRYVTSFGPQGYEDYGRDFLASYVKYMKDPLYVFVEAPCDFQHPLVTFKKLQQVEGFKQFLNRASFPAMHGKIWGQLYNYRFAVTKFCRKQFAQLGAAKLEHATNGDWLIWIDADVLLGNALPPPAKGPFMYYLGRPEWHSCASYVAWDLQHTQNQTWWQMLENLYSTGTIFALPEWHDSYVNDWMRDDLKVSAANLAEPFSDQLKGPANVFDFVFPGCHHKKGNLKFASNHSS